MPTYDSTATRVDRDGNVVISTMSHVEPPKPPSVPTPGYFSKVRNGETLPIGIWNRTFVKASHSGDKVHDSRVFRKSTGVQAGGVIISGDIHWPGRRFELDAKALSDIYLSSGYPGMIDELATEAIHRAKNTSWDIVTFGAELDKTYRLVSKAGNRTFERVERILTRRGPGKVIRNMVEFAEAWMEYRYGWRLLMYDLEEANEAVEKASNRILHSLQRRTAHRQFSHKSTIAYDSGNCYWGDNVSTVYADVHTDHLSKIVVDDRVGAGVRSSFFHNVTINPFLTAWEIIPYSFIIDWFVNVGDNIGAHTPTLGRSLVYLWHSRKTVTSTASSTTWTPQNPSQTFYDMEMSGGSCGAYIERTEYQRSPIANPGWSLNIDVNLDFSKFLDLASLFLIRDNNVRKRLEL